MMVDVTKGREAVKASAIVRRVDGLRASAT